MREQRRFDEEAKAALEALKKEKILQELAEEYEVYPNQISAWKKQLLSGASGIFEPKNQKEKNSSKPGEKSRNAVLKEVLIPLLRRFTAELRAVVFPFPYGTPFPPGAASPVALFYAVSSNAAPRNATLKT